MQVIHNIMNQYVIKICMWVEIVTQNCIHDFNILYGILTNLYIEKQYVNKICIWAKILTQNRLIISSLIV